MSRPRDRRPMLAALLSVLQPGLGHLYLRSWLRALLYGGLWVGTLAVVVVSAGLELAPFEILAAAAGFFPAIEGFPPEAMLAVVAVTVFATLDAYWLAARKGNRISDVAECPACGKELDPSLDFCHWCTTPLEREAGDP